MKYLIVLFKNKKRKKILKKYKTIDKAKLYFKKIIDENKIVFEKRVENGKKCFYEIGLLENSPTDFNHNFVKDEFGRNVKLEIDDSSLKILEISKFDFEEELFDFQKKNKITFNSFVKSYISSSGLKFVSKLNNKVLVQDEEIYNIFSLKSDEDSYRFLECLENYLRIINKTNCIVVFDTTKQYKKFLYEKLESSGINKSFLYRNSTTFFSE